ncbi:MAG: asparaginase [Planctomycetes bacterium]|nr:asparaginase [Planctomycetota bacterium]
METQTRTKPPASAARRDEAERGDLYPENPVLVRVWRGERVESQHRGAWVLCDPDGTVIDGMGSWKVPIFARSSVKCLQALPLLETGAADHFGFSDAEIALALSSHNAEALHTEAVKAVLARIGLSPGALQCGPQAPGDPDVRNALRERGEKPTGLHNNCSGKHTGFLALTCHLGADPEHYLDPESPAQRLVRRAVLEMTGLAEEQIYTAVDGCSAPTFQIPLSALAAAFARVSNPAGLAAPRRAACERMLSAVAANPIMLAGHHQRICTDIARVTRGRLFPKVGAEAVYAIGVRGQDRALAIKIDDGNYRGMHPVVVALLRRFGFATGEELAALESWEERRISDLAGHPVGRTEVVFARGS